MESTPRSGVKKLVYADEYQAERTPQVIIRDQKGNVVFNGGAADRRNVKKATKFYLKDALAALANGKAVPNSNPRTLGCYIQR